MESYISAISPLFFAFRIFGVKFEPAASSKCTRFQMIISRCLHYLAISLFIFIAFLQTFQPKKNLSEACMFIMCIVSSFQMVAARATFDLSIESYVQMFNKTGEIMREFDGKEKLFLKKLKLLIRCLSYYPVHGIIQYCFNANKSFSELMQNDGKIESVSPVAIVLFLGFLCFSLPVGVVWTATIDLLVIVHFLTLYIVFKILEKMYLSGCDEHSVSYRKIINFILIHRKACRLVEFTNQTMRNLLFFWTAVKCTVPLFFVLQYIDDGSLTSIGFMVEAIITISIEMTLAGLVNKMMVKSLSTLYHLVNCQLPLKKSNKLSIKLDLYSAHIEVWKPFLTIGFLSHVTPSSVIPVLDFTLTYLLFVCKLRGQWNG
ncbi:hypothetical protein CHUAL_008514 [Chamberlinius hualienensis]